ncbi:hypothetical protein EDB84DRAFT_1584330 [Lactarius hengduanensis]|nr:hypothetical protein EDB84DRAFT_1584330 [Lactarius hengduanensis]
MVKRKAGQRWVCSVLSLLPLVQRFTVFELFCWEPLVAFWAFASPPYTVLNASPPSTLVDNLVDEELFATVNFQAASLPSHPHQRARHHSHPHHRQSRRVAVPVAPAATSVPSAATSSPAASSRSWSWSRSRRLRTADLRRYCAVVVPSSRNRRAVGCRRAIVALSVVVVAVVVGRLGSRSSPQFSHTSPRRPPVPPPPRSTQPRSHRLQPIVTRKSAAATPFSNAIKIHPPSPRRRLRLHLAAHEPVAAASNPSPRTSPPPPPPPTARKSRRYEADADGNQVDDDDAAEGDGSGDVEGDSGGDAEGSGDGDAEDDGGCGGRRVVTQRR